MTNIKQITAALMAFDPLLARQGLAQADLDMDRVLAVLPRLKEGQPGIKWALVGVEGGEWVAHVYDDLLEAAKDFDPGAEGDDYKFLVACKVEEGKVYLSMDGKWVALEYGAVELGDSHDS
jgi:hypothetical protein